jgi:hypothetical protein
MKILRNIFVFIFLAAITIPVINMDTKTRISMLERRALAGPPVFIIDGKTGAQKLAALTGQIDAYITDRFAFRSQLVSLMNHINFFVLHKSHDKKLLVGKDKWLFYMDRSLGDEYANFKKTNLYTPQEMNKFLIDIKNVNSFCKENNIKFLFLIVPPTSSVYPEKYPFPRPEGISRTEQILNALPSDIRERTIYPLDYLLSKKEKHTQPLYYNNGIHWNKLGVYYAYELIHEKLKADFPNIPDVEFKFTPYMDPGEDNYALLWWGIKRFGNFKELMNVEPVDGWSNHYSYVTLNSIQDSYINSVVGYPSKKGKYGVVTANKDQSLPTAIVMRESYFTDLEPFTSLMFSNAEYIWTQPEKRSLGYLMQLPEKPDIFIWEIGERGMEAIPMVGPGIFPTD